MKDKEYIKIRDKFYEEVEPKAIKVQIDSWNFNTNSTDENMKKMEKSQEEVLKLIRNEEFYNKLKEIEKSGLEDKHLAKQLKNLLKEFDEEFNSGKEKKALNDKTIEIISKFNNYVPKIEEKETSLAEISQIMLNEKDVDIRKKANAATIKGGDAIADDLIELTKMRNEFAKTKGYNNFFDYMLIDGYEEDPNSLKNLIDEVYNNSKEINKQIQSEYKKELAEEFGIGVEDLREYHYGLLLDNNPTKEVNKSLKTKEQVVDICKKAYWGMGFDIDNMPITLDLFPRKNKNSHGFCFDIDAGKDARILANLTNTTKSIEILCHELGHCVYHIGINPELSYLDRRTYPTVTEAVAMMMGDLKQREDILKGIVSDKVLDKYKKDLKKTEAIFINRCLLIIDFEKAMFENPDQNLPQLWHNLKVKYTGANNDEEPNNEWATIPHYITHPVYYLTYFKATLLMAQMYNLLHKELGNITENKETANYLNNNLFRYGTSIEEDELIEKFTGEPLSSKAICEILA